jgi:hypothetical protein
LKTTKRDSFIVHSCLFLLRRPKGDVVDLVHTPLLLRPCGLTLRAVGILNRLRHIKVGERRGRQQKHEPHLAAEVRLREQRLASGQAVLLDWVRRRHRHLQQIRHLVAFDHERIPRRVVRVRRAVDNVMLQIARERQSAVSLAQSDAVAGDLKHLVAAGCLEQDLGTRPSVSSMRFSNTWPRSEPWRSTVLASRSSLAACVTRHATERPRRERKVRRETSA